MHPQNPSNPGMRTLDKREQFKRRSFLRGSGLAAIGVAVIPVAGLGPTTALAQDFPQLGEATGRTLLRMARDIYPHDKLADRYYLQALGGHEKAAAQDAGLKQLIREGVAELNASAKSRHGKEYAQVEREADRVALLKGMETGAFFQKIRGDLVTGLYDNKEVWPQLGYEGSSWEKGGYLARGFNDIDWL